MYQSTNFCATRCRQPFYLLLYLPIFLTCLTDMFSVHFKFRLMYWNISYVSLANSSLYNLTCKDMNHSYWFALYCLQILFSLRMFVSEMELRTS